MQRRCLDHSGAKAVDVLIKGDATSESTEYFGLALTGTGMVDTVTAKMIISPPMVGVPILLFR